MSEFARKKNYGPVRRASVAAALVLGTIASSVSAIAPANASETFEYIIDGGTAMIENCVNYSCPSDLVIPASLGGAPVTAINDYAFKYANLNSVSLPSSLQTIGEGAFQNNNLTTLVLPNSVTSTGSEAFDSNQLTSVTLSTSMTSIGVAAFSYNQLSSITIPNSVTSIQAVAFLGNQLSSITIPKSVTSIGFLAFAENKLTSLAIPASVTYIGDVAFMNNMLTSVSFAGNNPGNANAVFIGNDNLPFVDVAAGTTGWDATYAGVLVRRPTGPSIKIDAITQVMATARVDFTLSSLTKGKYDRVAYSVNDGPWVAWGVNAKSAQVIKGLMLGRTYSIRAKAHVKGGTWTQASDPVSITMKKIRGGVVVP